MRSLFWLAALVVVPVFAEKPQSGWPTVPALFVDLSYPPEALAARIVGVVVVRVTTDVSGRVVGAESLSGSDRLVPAVVANVKQWTFSRGARTEVVVYRFEIDHGGCNDDSRSLFRLVKSNLAVISACTQPGRGWVPPPVDELEFVSSGGPSSYPSIAQQARVEGIVVLELSIDGSGGVVESRSLTELPLLTDAAVAHSKRWRFRPSERRRGIIVYEFALDSRQCEPRDRTEFWRVSADFWRLSACSPLVGGGWHAVIVARHLTHARRPARSERASSVIASRR